MRASGAGDLILVENRRVPKQFMGQVTEGDGRQPLAFHAATFVTSVRGSLVKRLRRIANVRRFVRVMIATDARNFVTTTGSLHSMSATSQDGVRQRHGSSEDGYKAVHGRSEQGFKKTWRKYRGERQVCPHHLLYRNDSMTQTGYWGLFVRLPSSSSPSMRVQFRHSESKASRYLRLVSA